MGPYDKWPSSGWKLRVGRAHFCWKPIVWRFATCLCWTWLGLRLVHPWFVLPYAAWSAGWDDCYRRVFLPYQAEQEERVGEREVRDGL
jgi:hypothetical protein